MEVTVEKKGERILFVFRAGPRLTSREDDARRVAFHETMKDNGRHVLCSPARPALPPARPPAGHSPLAVHFSSRTDDWSTPQWLYDALHREFRFTLDPCSTDANAKCPRHFTRFDNGLARDWSSHSVFMNPPYGREIGLWMRKAFESAQTGAAIVVCLVPARTDTQWWHAYAMRGEVRFLKGRLKFGGARNSAPFPSAIVIFRPGQHH
jgi:phage N-6-adenine-methyltransferase